MNAKQLSMVKPICLIVIGALSVIFSIVCFAADTGAFERQSAYGGDAYTGIQNAGAITANNVKCVAQICSIGFGGVFLLAGLTLLAVGIASLLSTVNLERESDASKNPSGKTAASASGVPTPPQDEPVQNPSDEKGPNKPEEKADATA